MTTNSQPQSENYFGPPVFFQPDQLVFLVTHANQDALSDKQIADLIGWSGTHAKDFLKLPVEIKHPTKDQIIVFPPKGLKFAAAGDIPPVHAGAKSRSPAVARPDSFTLLFPNVLGVSLEELVRLGHYLDDHRADAAIAKFLEPATLDQVSLNWLGSGAPVGGDSGGPAFPPSLPTGAVPPYQFNFMDPGLAALGNGQGLAVAILDTAPCAHDLADAYNTWGPTSTNPNPLLVELLDPAGILEVENASAADLVRVAGTTLTGFPFEIADHGLFVSGIIHSIVPSARLHLIEVLGPYGVGDIQLLARGFRRVLTLMAANPSHWIVNCSVLLDAPADIQQLAIMIYILAHPPAGLSPAVLAGLAALAALLLSALTGGNPGLLLWLIRRQTLGIEKLCNAIYLMNSRVIAAAGNDNGKPGATSRPGPRYPAAFDSVLGVGATDDLVPGAVPPAAVWTPASYSNIADVPVSAGLTVFGGETTPGPAMLGVYTADIPGASPNVDGWAWWGGTSFSTAVISGVVAALFGSPAAPASTQAAIQLFSTMGLLPSTLGEEIVQARQ